MKQLIFAFGLLLFTLSGFSQSGGFGSPASPSSSTDTTTNPSGVGFGGAMGGATSTAPATAPTGATSAPNAVSPGYGNPQQMQDISSPSNVPSTTAPAPASNLPAGTGSTSEPTSVPRTNVPSATGVGTGSPSGF